MGRMGRIGRVAEKVGGFLEGFVVFQRHEDGAALRRDDLNRGVVVIDLSDEGEYARVSLAVVAMSKLLDCYSIQY